MCWFGAVAGKARKGGRAACEADEAGEAEKVTQIEAEADVTE